MRAHMAGLAFALIVGSEAAAAVATVEGILFWHNMPLVKDLLWLALAGGLIAGAVAWYRTARWEQAKGDAVDESLKHPTL